MTVFLLPNDRGLQRVGITATKKAMTISSSDQWAAMANPEATTVITAETVSGAGARYIASTPSSATASESGRRTLPDGGAVRTYTDVTDYVEAQGALGEKSRALRITPPASGISRTRAGLS